MTVTELLAIPPSPVHVKVKVLVVVRLLRVSLPKVFLLPDQASEASQPVAPVENQLSVVEPPEAIEVAFADIETVGAGGGGRASTVTTTDWLAEPPALEQVRVNVVVAMSGPTLSLSASALVPVHPSVASQSVASVDVQDSVDHSPAVTFVGAAASETVGAGGGG